MLPFVDLRDVVARTPSLFIHLKIFDHVNIDGGGRVLIKTWLSYQRWSRGLAHVRELVEERYVIVREQGMSIPLSV